MSTSRQINWKKNLFFVWLSQLLSLAGFGAALPFIAVFMRDCYGIEDLQMRGVLVSVFYFAGMLSFSIWTPIWGRLADRFGRKIMLLRASFGAGVCFPCMIFAPNVWWLIAIRFITSMFSGTVNAAQTLIVATTPKERHGFALGLISSAVWSGNMIGLLSGGIVVHYFGFKAAFFFCGILYIISALLVMFFVRENFVPEPRTLSAASSGGWVFTLHRRFSRSAMTILFLFIIMAFARRFDDSFLALQVENIGGKTNVELYTSWISAFAAVGGVIAGLGMGWLTDRIRPGRVALWAVCLTIPVVICQGCSQNLWQLGAARFLTFIFAGGLDPALLAMLARVTPPENRGEVFGWSSTFRTLGLVAAAPLGGTIVYYFGVRAVYFVSAASFVSIIFILFHAMKLIDIHLEKNDEQANDRMVRG